MALAHELHVVAEGMGDLVASHMRLARLEIQDDVQWMGKRLGFIFALAPLVVVGYAFLCGAMAMALQSVISLTAALVGIGLVNVAIGIIGIVAAAQQLRDHDLLGHTTDELETSSTMLVRTTGIAP